MLMIVFDFLSSELMGIYPMQSKITAMLSLIPLGLVASALMLAYFKSGLKAFQIFGGYKRWPKESKRLFLIGFCLYIVISIVDLILMIISG